MNSSTPVAVSPFSPAQLALPLFGIVEHTGSYEDAYQKTIYVTHDEAAANAYVEYYNALYESMRAKVAQSHKEGDAWAKANPQPPTPDVSKIERVAIPDWKGIKVITREMRDERQRLKAENEARTAVAMAPVREWFRARLDAINNWQAENFTAEEKAVSESDNCTHYEVETLSWMPPLDSLLPASVFGKESPVLAQ